MKRDMDYLRELMLEIEDGNSQFSTNQGDKKSYHLHLLLDKFFIDGGDDIPNSDLSGEEFWYNIRLTFDGCEFLESVRDQDRYDDLKKVVRDKGLGLTVESLLTAISFGITKAFGG